MYNPQDSDKKGLMLWCLVRLLDLLGHQFILRDGIEQEYPKSFQEKNYTIIIYAL